VLVYLGEISFATYMCHTLVLAVVVPQGFGSESSWFAYIGAVYAMSALLYHVIERPMQRVIRQFVDSFLSKPTETLA
jgi:peptidoglycan/LPS O-acetylase OafA/YrhL